MFQPFLWLAVAFTAGVWAAGAVAAPAAIGLGLAVGSLAAAWRAFARSRETRAAALCLLACAALGAAIRADAEARFASHPLRALPEGAAVDLTGILLRTPSIGLERDQIWIGVETAESGGRPAIRGGRARVSIPRTAASARLLAYRVGDRLRISASVLSKREFANFGPPFAERFARTQGFHLAAAAKSALLVERIASAPAGSPARAVSALRRALLNVLAEGFADPASPGGIRPEGAVLEALLLGERGRMDEGLTRSLQESGLFHIIAISGAHVGIMAVFLFAAFRAVGATERAASLGLAVFLVFYAVLVEGRASVTRAVVMALLHLAGRLLWKDARLLNTLGLSAFLILAADPFQIDDQGFVLTYAATLTILLFYEPILKRLPRLPLKLAESTALSLSAQVGALPLTVLAFHRVALSAIPLNYAAAPLVAVLMGAGYLLLPVGLIGPGPARFAAAVLRPLAAVFIRTLSLLDGVRPLSYRVPTLPGWAAVVYAAAFLALLAPHAAPAARRVAAAAAAASFLLVVLVPFPAGGPYLRVTILDVGQADSILIEIPGRGAMLIDGGGSAYSRFDVGENVVSPALWDRRIRRLRVVVLTHDHPDHRRGLMAVARNFGVGEFWRSPGGRPDPERAELDALLGPAERWTLTAGSTRRIGDAVFEVLSPEAPAAGGRGDENDRSLVLRLTYGRTVFLFPGDIGTGVESRLIGAGRAIRADVLKAPHHGSRTSGSDGFLAAVHPEWIVLTAGRGGAAGLPNAEALARMRKTGARLLRTDEAGAVEILSNGQSLRVRTAQAQLEGH